MKALGLVHEDVSAVLDMVTIQLVWASRPVRASELQARSGVAFAVTDATATTT
jgi:hypothetical protein